MPREILLPILERLRKFVLRAKVTIEDVSESLCVAGARRGASEVHWPSYSERDAVGVAALGHDATRVWLVGADADIARHPLAQHALSSVEWRLEDIRAGLPQVYAATSEAFVAQMLNLDLLDGISFTKGCYTGQEIIARTQHLGRIKRRLFRLTLPAGNWLPGQTLRLLDGRQGRLTDVIVGDTRIEALAVLNVDAGTTANADAGGDGVPGDAVAVAELPLPYSLKIDDLNRLGA